MHAASSNPAINPSTFADSAPMRAAVWRTFLLVAALVAIDTFIVALTTEKLNFLYKDRLHLDADGVASLTFFLTIPAYLRPVIGYTSDLVPLFGYHRRSYFLIAGLLEAGALLGLSLISHYTYLITALLVIAMGAGVVLMFVMMESVMVRIGNASGQTGRMQTVQQFVRQALIVIVAGHLSGYVTQHWSYAACFRSAALATLLVLPLTFLIEDPKVVHGGASDESAQERAIQAAEKKLDHARSVAALKDAARTPALWAVIAFILFVVASPGTGTVQFYYTVDYLHYTKQFLGDLNSYTALGQVIGFLTYALIATRLSGRDLVWALILLPVIGSIPYFWLHSPLSAIIMTVGTNITGGWQLLALLALTARACPPRAEATYYMLGYAMQFLGSVVSNKLGAIVYDLSGGPGHGIVHGWNTAIWAGIIWSAAAVVFIPFLPAWGRSSARLKPEKEEAAVAGLA